MPHGRFGFSPLDSGSGSVSEDVWPLVDMSELESDSGILSRLNMHTHTHTHTHTQLENLLTKSKNLQKHEENDSGHMVL